MEGKFKKTDIGRRIILELNPSQDRVAKLLGASSVRLEGVIRGLNVVSLKVEVMPPQPCPLLLPHCQYITGDSAPFFMPQYRIIN